MAGRPLVKKVDLLQESSRQIQCGIIYEINSNNIDEFKFIYQLIATYNIIIYIFKNYIYVSLCLCSLGFYEVLIIRELKDTVSINVVKSIV